LNTPKISFEFLVLIRRRRIKTQHLKLKTYNILRQTAIVMPTSPPRQLFFRTPEGGLVAGRSRRRINLFEIAEIFGMMVISDSIRHGRISFWF
jgi:hypothetical protein